MRVILVGPLSMDARAARGICNDDVVVAVDGGWARAVARKWRVALAIGDWDSLEKKSKYSALHPYTEVVNLRRKKNESDTAAALREIRTRYRFESVLALGFSGGRMDHQLALWMDTCAWIRAGERVDFGHAIVLGSGSHQLSLRGTFSVFSFKGAKSVCISGAVYGQKPFDLRPSSLGLSNRALRRVISVSFKQGALLVIGSDRNGGVASSQSKSN